MTIIAKYPGTCRKCGRQINVGDRIDWQKGRGASHIECPAQKNAATDAGPIKIQSSRREYRVGSTIRTQRHGLVTIVTAGKKYYREDGLSFGLSDDSGYMYFATCRPATEDESAPIIEAERIRGEKTDAAAALAAIKNEIRRSGEYPEGSHTPDGNRIADTQDIYGGGDWFVIGNEYIWYVQNNGMDGDNWGANNVRTGGAGAIGWRIGFSADLAARINDAVEKL